MPTQNEGQLPDAAILAKSVETVFRKLIRFLVGRISLVRLQEMIRYIYVEEAEKSLKAEYLGKNVPMTKLALLTGLDTRQLVLVKGDLEARKGKYREQFLAELTPESAVIEAWNESINKSPDKDKAKQLTYGDENSEFEALVKSAIPTRGITMQSIIKRLIVTKSVSVDQKNKILKLIVDKYSPYLSEDEPNIVNAALSAISNLLSTIDHNVNAKGEEKFYQRQFWTFRLSAENQATFRKATFAMLEKYESMARVEMAPYESESYGTEMLTAGVGFYYFEDAQGTY
jgi:hypothetical protein